VSLPRRPYAVVLRSPHARISGVDPAAALGRISAVGYCHRGN